MNEFKSSRHTYQVRPLSTEAWDSLRSLGVLKRFRGKSSRNNVKSGGRFPILPQITTNFRSKQSFELKRVNFHNLINIQIKSDETNEVKRNNNPVIHHSDFLLFNSRSIVNKALELKDFAVDNNVDFMAITETWLKSDVNNNNTIGEFCPTGYKFLHQPRETGRGGGVGLLVKDVFIAQRNFTINGIFTTFEHINVSVKSSGCSLNIIVIYRPPSTCINQFIDEFSTLLEQLVLSSGYLLIVGDFNIHVDDVGNSESANFLALIDSFDLKQMVSFSTHVNGHSLDLVVVRNSEPLGPVVNIETIDPALSDHLAVKFKIPITKQPFKRKMVKYRNFKSLDSQSLATSISESRICADIYANLPDMVNGYFDSLTAVIDQVAPIKTRLITIRPKAPWYTIDIDNEKKCRRRYERKWRRTKDPTDRNNYLEKCKHVSQMIHESKSNFYSSVISENKGNQRILFQTIDKLLHHKNDVVLPTSSSDEHLAERFADYFINKITTIHTNLLRSDAVFLHQPVGTESELFEFYPISAKSVEAIIRSSPSKCCCLDPLPTWLLKEHLHLLLPPITNIVNMSLGSTFPSSFKKSIIVPLLKKPSLDAEVLKHYRPVSNLAFISKIIEKAVVLQLNDHLSTNNLFETYQSAYRRLHSTETALLKVQNDILIALDNKQAVVLLLLDLSATFDTVCHTTLLKLLKSRYGITGKVLTWMESYLTNRCQAVMVNNHISSSRDLSFGVPQGSVLGPILFSLYIAPMTDIIRQHGLEYHLYADDTQMYLTFNPVNENLSTIKSSIESCVSDVRAWMSSNCLKLNDDKSELLIFHSKRVPRPNITAINIGEESISPVESCRNIGVTYDETLSFDEHIRSITKTAFWHLRNIYQIRHYLDTDSLLILVHAFITSKLDFCNSLLIGLPKCLLKRLQSVQNAAARLVSGSRKYDHISPVLHQLHWLPVDKRITYKILLMVFKCLHNLAPSYLSNLIIKYTPNRALRSSSKNLLVVPPSRTKGYGDRAFSVCGPKLWNNLPESLRHETKLEPFKKNLKTYLF